MAEATSWVSQGNYAVADIQKSQVRTVSLQHLSDKPLKMEKKMFFFSWKKNNKRRKILYLLTSINVRRVAAKCQEHVEATVVTVHHLLTPTCL